MRATQVGVAHGPWTRPLRLGALGIAALTGGCGGAGGEGRPPGVMAVKVVSAVGAPCALGSLVVTAGGQSVRLAPAPPLPRDGEPSTVGELRLPPGEHAVSARASARCAGGAPDGVETVVAEAGQVLRLERGEAPSLTVALSSPDGALAVELRVQGALLRSAPGVADRELVCAGVRSSRKALCRAEADLALASTRKNVAWALCVRDALPALREVTELSEDAQDRRDAEAEALMGARLAALAAQVEGCASVDGPEVGATTITQRPR